MGRKSKGRTSAVLRSNLKPLQSEDSVTTPTSLSDVEDSIEETGTEEIEKVKELLTKLERPIENNIVDELTSGFITQDDFSILHTGNMGPNNSPAQGNPNNMFSQDKNTSLDDKGEQEREKEDVCLLPCITSEGDPEEADNKEAESVHTVSLQQEVLSQEELIEKLRQLSLKNDRDEKEVVTLQGRLESKEADLKLLEKRLQHQEKLALDCEELRKQFAECKISKQTATKEAKGYKHKLDKTVQEMEALQKELSAIEARFNDLAQINTKLEKEAIDAAEEMKLVRAQGESKLAYLKQQSEEQVAALTTDFQERDASRNREGPTDELVELKDKLQKAQELNDQIRVEYQSTLANTVSDKERAIEQLLRAKMEIESLQKSYGENQDHLTQYQALLNTERATAQHLTQLHRTALEQKERAWAEIRELKIEVEKLRASILHKAQGSVKRKSSPEISGDDAKKAKDSKHIENAIKESLNMVPQAEEDNQAPVPPEEASSTPGSSKAAPPRNQSVLLLPHEPALPAAQGTEDALRVGLQQSSPATTARATEARPDPREARPQWPLEDVPHHPRFEGRPPTSQVITISIHPQMMAPERLADSYHSVTTLKEQVNLNHRLLEQGLPHLVTSQMAWDQHGADRDLLVQVARYLAIPRKPSDLTNCLRDLAADETFPSDQVKEEIRRASARWVFPDMTLGSSILLKIFDPAARHYRRFAIRFLLIILTPAYHVHFTKLAMLGGHIEQVCSFLFGPRTDSTFVQASLHLLITLATAMSMAFYQPDKMGLPATNPAGVLPVDQDGAPSTDHLRLLQSMTGFRANVIDFVNSLHQRSYMFNDVASHIEKKEKPALKKLFTEDTKFGSPSVRLFYHLARLPTPPNPPQPRPRGHQGATRRRFQYNY